MAEVPEDVRAAARWLAYQPLTLPDHVADHLDVVLAYVLGHTTREGTPRYLVTRAGATRPGEGLPALGGWYAVGDLRSA